MTHEEAPISITQTSTKFVPLVPTSYHVSPLPDGSFVLHLSSDKQMYNFIFRKDPEGTDTTRMWVQGLRDIAHTILEKTDAVRNRAFLEMQERAELKRLSAKYASASGEVQP
jgi:hypothetical protein